jgi:hypothetical protein
MSGSLFEKHCPVTGPRNSQIMLTVFWKCISYKDLDEDEDNNHQNIEMQWQSREHEG